MVLVRGDDDLEEQKLIDGLGTQHVRPAHPEEIRDAVGALPGSIGAVGVADLPVIADPALQGRTNMVTGANEDDWHVRGVDVARDIEVSRWLDVRRARERRSAQRALSGGKKAPREAPWCVRVRPVPSCWTAVTAVVRRASTL